MQQQLDRLQVESMARRTELRSIAEQLCEVQSRRVVLRSVVADMRAHADISDIVTRAARKIARAPRSILRRIQRA